MGEALLNKLRGDCKWAEVDSVFHLKPVDRFNVVWRWCKTAAEKHDEKSASYFYDLVALATPDMIEDKAEAEARLAGYAAQLYAELPPHKNEKRSVYDGDNWAEVARQADTLADLKQRLLKEVALRWQRTKDEEEAKRLDRFLVKTAQSRDAREVSRVTEALNAAMETVHHKERAIRLMTSMAAEVKDNGPARKLLIGVMRTLQLSEILQLAPLFVQLPFDGLSGRYNELPPAALFDAIDRDAETYRCMHAMMGDLRTELKIDNFGGNGLVSFRPNYHHDGKIDLDIGVRVWPDLGHEQENAFHKKAEEVSAQIDKWLLVHKRSGRQEIYIVKLRVFLPVQHGEPKLVRLLELRG